MAFRPLEMLQQRNWKISAADEKRGLVPFPQSPKVIRLLGFFHAYTVDPLLPEAPLKEAAEPDLQDLRGHGQRRTLVAAE